LFWGRRSRDHMVVRFTTTYAIGSYHHWCWEFKSRCTALCDKACQSLSTGRWFSPGILVPTATKTDHHDITEILLKVALNTINPKPKPNLHLIFVLFCLSIFFFFYFFFFFFNLFCYWLMKWSIYNIFSGPSLGRVCLSQRRNYVLFLHHEVASKVVSWHIVSISSHW
jgi:hypothetical protein